MLPSLLFGAYLGFSSGLWHMLALSAATVLIWLLTNRFRDARAVDLSEPVHFNGPDVWIGDYLLPSRELFWKREWHQVVFRAYENLQRPQEFDLQLELETHGAHALIIGPTGSGKSELLKLLLSQKLKSPTDCDISLLDFKGGATFGRIADAPRVIRFATDIDGHDPETLWNEIRAEIGRRELALAARGASRIEDPTMFQTPRHYIFIDELSAALAESTLAGAALTMVATRGRSLGIHLIAATQSAQGIPRAMLTNMRIRIALAEADPIDLAQLNLKRPAEPASVLPGWASGICQKPGSLSSHFNFPLGASFEF